MAGHYTTPRRHEPYPESALRAFRAATARCESADCCIMPAVAPAASSRLIRHRIVAPPGCPASARRCLELHGGNMKYGIRYTPEFQKTYAARWNKMFKP
jgi:hypothetical protein